MDYSEKFGKIAKRISKSHSVEVKSSLGNNNLSKNHDVGGAVMTILMLVVWAVLGLAMSGCTIKATTDTTTDGTTEFMSSTSGKTWWTEEGLVKHGQHAGAFVSVNHDNLLENIARREGEYLLVFGKILQVSTEQETEFANRLQQHYRGLSAIPVHEGEIYVSQFLHQVVLVTPHFSSPHLQDEFFPGSLNVDE